MSFVQRIECRSFLLISICVLCVSATADEPKTTDISEHLKVVSPDTADKFSQAIAEYEATWMSFDRAACLVEGQSIGIDKKGRVKTESYQYLLAYDTKSDGFRLLAPLIVPGFAHKEHDILILEGNCYECYRLSGLVVKREIESLSLRGNRFVCNPYFLVAVGAGQSSRVRPLVTMPSLRFRGQSDFVGVHREYGNNAAEWQHATPSHTWRFLYVFDEAHEMEITRHEYGRYLEGFPVGPLYNSDIEFEWSATTRGTRLPVHVSTRSYNGNNRTNGGVVQRELYVRWLLDADVPDSLFQFDTVGKTTIDDVEVFFPPSQEQLHHRHRDPR